MGRLVWAGIDGKPALWKRTFAYDLRTIGLGQVFVEKRREAAADFIIDVWEGYRGGLLEDRLIRTNSMRYSNSVFVPLLNVTFSLREPGKAKHGLVIVFRARNGTAHDRVDKLFRRMVTMLFNCL